MYPYKKYCLLWTEKLALVRGDIFKLKIIRDRKILHVLINPVLHVWTILSNLSKLRYRPIRSTLRTFTRLTRIMIVNKSTWRIINMLSVQMVL
jgi:hypothetical protein